MTLKVKELKKILDGKVILENFKDSKSGFKGKSMSVYNPKTKTWHQAWVDNAGGYYDFIGGLVNGEKVFKTQMMVEGDKKLQKRMRFSKVTKNSIIWYWEHTNNGGRTWQLKWRITYKRIQ